MKKWFAMSLIALIFLSISTPSAIATTPDPSQAKYSCFDLNSTYTIEVFNSLCKTLYENNTFDVLYSAEESHVMDVGNIYMIYRNGIFIDSIFSLKREESATEFECIVLSYSDISDAVTSDDKANLTLLLFMMADNELDFNEAEEIGITIFTSTERTAIKNGYQYTYDGGHIWEVRKATSTEGNPNNAQRKSSIQSDKSDDLVDRSDDFENFTKVPSKFIKGMKLPADTWYAADVTRNYFTLCMIQDCLDVWTEDETLISAEAIRHNSIYMVHDIGNISVWQFGENDLMIFLYDFGANSGYYTVISVDEAYTKAAEYMKALETNGTIPSFVQIESTEIMELISSST